MSRLLNKRFPIPTAKFNIENKTIRQPKINLASRNSLQNICYFYDKQI